MPDVVGLRETFTESYAATPASVGRARADVAEYAARAGANLRHLDRVRLAVSEAVTNAIVHAYRGAPGTVQVTVATAGRDLWVLVTDDGCGFQTPAETPGLGLGLALIADATDEFEITERGGGGTEARMRFALDAAAAFAE